uniref:Uncharacterized protein n=1 Tax=Molossus molossus TaxID=27622 RepID=A0A7J8BJR6_MOLMO|nr:hypothetical protein HJG59_010216 [Molossus molossus]
MLVYLQYLIQNKFMAMQSHIPFCCQSCMTLCQLWHCDQVTDVSDNSCLVYPSKEYCSIALASLAQRLERQAEDQRVLDLIPVKGTYLSCGLVSCPGWGPVGGNHSVCPCHISVSLSPPFLFLSLPPTLSEDK